MQLNQYHIIKIHDKEHIIYDDEPFEKACETYLSEIEPELYQEWLKDKTIVTEIPFEQWVVHHMINIAGELLEDVNKHSCTGEPLWLWELLKQADVPVDKQHTFFQNYLKDIFGKYGY